MHHFIGITLGDDSSVIDPLSKQTTQYDIYDQMGSVAFGTPVIGIRTTTGNGANVSLWETYIGKYMGISGSGVNDYSVSNFIYETNENESKRLIRVLHPRYLDTVKKELENLLRV